MNIQPTPPTVKGPAEWFTGDVSFDVLAKGDTMRVNAVRFAPGARTAWHHHLLGQTLHLAMWEGDSASTEPETTWGEHVTDDEYNGHYR